MPYLIDIYETLDGLHFTKRSYEYLLSELDKLNGIAPQENDTNLIIVSQLTKKILTFFEKYLSSTITEWYIESSPHLYTTVKKLEAIAYLSGNIDEILAIINKYPLLKEIHHSIPQYKDNNFLTNTEELAFKNFDRHLLTIQFIIRILDPKLIQQINEQVCGVVGFMQALVLFNPLLYAQTVCNLALNGSYALQQKTTNTKKLVVRIKEPLVLTKVARTDAKNEPADADHISLIGFRSAMNTTASYSPSAGSLQKILFGVTRSKDLKKWMEESGFENTTILPLRKRKHIKQLEYLIEDGYTIGLCITGDLTDILLGNIPANEPNKLKQLTQLLGGHFILLRHISFDEITDKIKLSIITWGQEAVDINVDFKIFIKNSLLSEAIIGLNAFSHSLLRAKNRESTDNFISPTAFCFQIKALLPKRSIYDGLHQIIKNATLHEDGVSWFLAAKNLQDAIAKLPQKIDLLPDGLLEIYKKRIIPGRFRGVINRFIDIENSASNDRKISALKKLALEKNIEAICLLILLCFAENRLEEISSIFFDETYTIWQNDYDKSFVQETLNTLCKEYIENLRTQKEIAEISALISQLQLNKLIDLEVLNELARRKEESLPFDLPCTIIDENEVEETATLTQPIRSIVPANKDISEDKYLNNIASEVTIPRPLKTPFPLLVIPLSLLASTSIAAITFIGLNMSALLLGSTFSALLILSGLIGLTIVASFLLTAAIVLIVDYLIDSKDMRKQDKLTKSLAFPENLEPVVLPDTAEHVARQSKLTRQNARFFPTTEERQVNAVTQTGLAYN